jgi:hypothetical protein
LTERVDVVQRIFKDECYCGRNWQAWAEKHPVLRDWVWDILHLRKRFWHIKLMIYGFFRNILRSLYK